MNQRYRTGKSIRPSTPGAAGAAPGPITRAVAMRCLTVEPQAKTNAVLAVFQEHPELVSLPVVDSDTQWPLGLISRALFMSTLARPFYKEIYLHRDCLVFMDKSPLVIESRCPLQETSIRIAEAGDKVLADGFIVVAEGRYVGMGRAQDVLRMMADVHEWQSQHLAIHRDRLEELVQSRTESLVKAREAAESAARAKASFLANMSHEIRTPMNAVIGLTHLMIADGLPEKQMDRALKIDRAARLLLAIVNDILDISKIGAGQMRLSAEALDINAIMSGVASVAAPLAHDKALKIVVEAAPLPEGRLLGDATRLTQALLNYVSNAIKFTERGTVTVRCLRVMEDRDSVLIRFEVEDTGIGLEATSLAQLFTPFTQADDSITRRFGGTGLGLSITKKLAQMMDGDAGAQSTPGVGSIFWFSARLAVAGQTASADIPRTTSPPSYERLAEEILRRFGGRPVLVVDDDPFNREVAEQILCNAGLAVSVAGDGPAAINALKRDRFALILMDMQMPGMDGLRTTGEIRRLPNGAQTPVVALTGNAFAEDRARCLAAGMDDFLVKPFDAAEFYAMVLRWLDMDGRRGQTSDR